MNTASRFDNRIENYVKYRPHYPTEILDTFRNEMNLEKSSVIADIGSGTGISAKLFLENGNKVIGIEPNKLMRKASENYLAEFPSFKVLDGTAGNTTLKDNSVNYIIAAQAFHWFNNKETAKEFRRILRKSGYIALIWNERLLDANEFLRGYENLLIKYGTDYEEVRHDSIQKESLETYFDKPFQMKIFKNPQTLDYQGLKGRILSSSYMPTEENPIFSEMEKTLKELFAEHSEKGKIVILYDTKIFYTKM